MKAIKIGVSLALLVGGSWLSLQPGFLITLEGAVAFFCGLAVLLDNVG